MDDDEDDDDGPPPLPARDYAPPPLVSLLDPEEDLMARSIYLEEQRMPNLDNVPDVPDVPEEHVYERSMSDEFNQNTTDLDLNRATDNELRRENGSGTEASGIAQADLLNFGDSMTQSSVFLVSSKIILCRFGYNPSYLREARRWQARAT